MKDIYDLALIVNFSNFPWDEVNAGISLSKKEPLLFYGHTRDAKLGDCILLTTPILPRGSWYRLGEESSWKNSENVKYFPLLQQWIRNSNIFKNTGRIVFFIQPIGVSTPAHIDEDLSRAPIEYQQPSEFIWVTLPIGGKRLLVNNVESSYASWFNSYKFHSTIPSDTITWSLRIDGKFTDDFKNKIKYDIL